MGHSIKAVIGKRADVQRFAEDWICKMIELPQDLGMVPLTIKLLEDMEERLEPSGDPSCSALEGLDSTVVEILKRYSTCTKLAYIETDYFGGVGTQGGVLYENGREVCPPRVGEGTVNALLKALGAWRKPDKDEFDCLELGKYRHIDE